MKNKALAGRLGKTLRQERLTRGLSQEKFAEIIGVSRTRAGALERGEVNAQLTTLEALANHLNIDPSEFLRR